MKTILYVITTVATLWSVPALASEFKNNPDRFPSISISGGYAKAETQDNFSGEDTDSDGFDFTVGTRQPISEAVTLFGSYTNFRSDAEAGILDATTDGFAIRFGVIVYFQR